MECSTEFSEFLREIRLTKDQRNDLRVGHKTLRERLHAFEPLKDAIVSSFLQGSYRRSTAVRPKGDRRADVDVIVVTRLSEKEFTPTQAMDKFIPFLNKHYKDKWRQQGRSFGIELSYVEMDLVLTSAPKEAQVGILESAAILDEDPAVADVEDSTVPRDWRLNEAWVPLSDRLRADAATRLAKSAAAQEEWPSDPLRIPDRTVGRWEDTHPLEQIRWTREKNKRCDGHFVNVVKAIKWWRLVNHEEPKHPKGFPLERLVGECCPDGIGSVAEGVTRTLEEIVTRYELAVAAKDKPRLPDYGVPQHDVFKSISSEDFAKFYAQVVDGALLARKAFDASDKDPSLASWRELFGSKFPGPSGGGSGGGFTPPKKSAVPGSGRFA